MRFFQPNHPITVDETARLQVPLETQCPISQDEVYTLPFEERFQHVDCGTYYRQEDLLTWVSGSNGNCPHCGSDSVVAQMRVMGLLGDVDFSDQQRFEWPVRAIKGWGSPQNFQSSTGALSVMLSQPAFKLLLEFRDRFGMTLLEYAIWDGGLNALILLIDAGANLNTASKVLTTPLHHAVRARRPEVVKLLLEHGADPTAIHERIETPRQLALKLFEETNESVFQDIIGVIDRTTAVFNDSDRYLKQHGNRGDTPLHIACLQGDVEHATRLINGGHGVDVLNNEHLTPLMSIAALGVHSRTDRAKTFEQLVDLLVLRGSNLLSRDRFGRTAVHLALCYYQFDAAQYLLEEGVKQGVFGDTFFEKLLEFTTNTGLGDSVGEFVDNVQLTLDRRRVTSEDWGAVDEAETVWQESYDCHNSL